MFDGKVPRTSRRRPVNLGGRSTATAKNRQDILQQTKKLRQERHAQQRQIKAATVLQTRVRGQRARRLVRQHVYQQATTLWPTTTTQFQSQQQQQQPSATFATTTRQLNVWLRLAIPVMARPQRSNRNGTRENITAATVVQMLQRYAMTLPTSEGAMLSTQQQCYTKYIWQQTLRLVTANNNGDAPLLDASTAQRILAHTLPPPPPSAARPQTTAILALPLGMDLGGLALVCEATTTQSQSSSLQTFLWKYLQTILPPTHEPAALLGVLRWKLSLQTPSNDNTVDMDHSSSSSIINNTSTLPALVQALLDHEELPRSSLSSPTNKNPLDTVAVQLFGSDPDQWLRLLSSVLSNDNNNNNASSSSLLPTWQVVALVDRVYRAVPELLQATILLARSGPKALEPLLLAETKQQAAAAKTSNSMDVEGVIVIDDSDDEDEDDDDSDENDTTNGERVVGKTAPASTATTTSAVPWLSSSTPLRVTKQDILTASKLERLFHETRDDHEARQTQQLTASLKSNNSNHNNHTPLLTQLANRLAQPSLWREWAQVLLTATTRNENDPHQVRARRSWVHCLGLILQGCHTGLYPRTSASSPFLTQLAFSSSSLSSSGGSGQKSLLELLWRYVLVQDTNANQGTGRAGGPHAVDPAQQAAAVHALQTWSLFCDVFGQQLIAMRDEQFLQQHTVPQDVAAAAWSAASGGSNNQEVIVLAEHVISRLKMRLYELYWAQPMLSQETKALLTCSLGNDTTTTAAEHNGHNWSAARVRLFLTGTKLWNSLYERWCRLMRISPFCDESTWLFPTLTSLTFGDGIVRGSGNHVDDPMDVDDSDEDSDSDDDEMTDENNNNRRRRRALQESTTTQDAETEALAGAFQDPKMARILTSIPQCMPFERRVKLFDTLLQIDKMRTQDESADAQATLAAMMRGEEFEGRSQVHVEIRRDALYQDSMQQLNQMGPKLKKKVKVSFINQHGVEEAGIDGGGVFKEFLDDLIKEAFTPPPANSASSSSATNAVSGLQLFAVTPLETLMVNPVYASDPKYLSHFEFLGRAVGKAVYESLLVEPQFCLPFLNSLLGKSNTLEDLKNYDPEYYSSLIKLQALSRQDLQGAALTFEAHLGHGAAGQTVELVPGGAHKPVTKDNVIPYAHMVSHRLLNVQSAAPVKAFLRGFRDLIPASWVRLFAAHELQKLISGDDAVGVDVAAFQACMSYSAGFHPSQPFIQQFWEIVHELSPSDQRKLLKFWTSCSRQPLLGFGSLDPRPCIQQVRLPDALFLRSPEEIAKEAPLPTAATCMNLLKLPDYRSKELLRRKLLASIEAGAGFELS